MTNVGMNRHILAASIHTRALQTLSAAELDGATSRELLSPIMISTSLLLVFRLLLLRNMRNQPRGAPALTAMRRHSDGLLRHIIFHDAE